MERIRTFIRPSQAYEPLENDPDSPSPRVKTAEPMSKFDYCIFLLLGCSMLWSFNMFLACATYFQGRFAENEFILDNFQSCIIAVSTVTNLGFMLYLSKIQKDANYPLRISISLLLGCIVFPILSLSTVIFTVGAKPYFAFTMLCVFLSSKATSLAQNGAMSLVNKFGGIYTQAIMTGQAVAGVLPAIAQIISVISIPQVKGHAGTASPKSAMAYFMTSAVVSSTTLIMFLIFLSRHKISLIAPPLKSSDEQNEDDPATNLTPKKSVPLTTLLIKLRYPSFVVWISFALSMLYPVFTQAIASVRPLDEDSSRLFQPDVFIPFSFLIWNIGDLTGRILCGFESLTLPHNPKLTSFLAVSRIGFIPLYFLCNIKGNGAAVNSDLFYWFVQFWFGVTGGWLGSNTIMSAPNLVEEDEKEATGGFMGLCLVCGLATGSLLSFFVLNI